MFLSNLYLGYVWAITFSSIQMQHSVDGNVSIVGARKPVPVAKPVCGSLGGAEGKCSVGGAVG